MSQAGLAEIYDTGIIAPVMTIRVTYFFFVVVGRFRHEHGSEGGETKNRSLAVMLVTASVLMTVLVTPNLTTITLIPHVMNTASPDYFTVSAGLSSLNIIMLPKNRLFGAEPFSEAMLTYYQLDSMEHNSVKC